MKILVICPLTTKGGGAITSWDISKQLGALGHQVVFIERAAINDPQKTAPSVKYLRSIDIFPLLPLNILSSFFFNTLVVFFARPDLVLALKPLPNSCLPALIAKLIGAKTIIHINDLDYEFYPKGVVKTVQKFFYRLFPRLFDRVSFPSLKLMQYVKNDLGLERDSFILLNQGADTQRFKVNEDKRLKEDLGLMNCKVVVYIASIGITASLEILSRIFHQILHSETNIKILVIGGGIYLDRFKQAIEQLGVQDKVVFAGFISYENIPRYLALADVGINYMENNKGNNYRVPIKVKEYLALGLPVVCNAVGDFEIMKNYIKIAQNDDEFVRLVKQLLSEGCKKNNEATHFMEMNYNWRTIVKNFNHEIETLVGRK